MDICLCMLKESNESRFDSYSVRNNVLHISHITFWDCRVHNFPTTFLEIAVYIYIDPFPTNFHITKSHLSLNNTEILRGVHVKYYCKLFLAIVCNSYDWSKSLNTKKKHPFKMGSCTFYCVNSLSLSLCILCVKMRTFVYVGKAHWRITKENAFHFIYPHHYLLKEIKEEYKSRL